ncbi:MAG: MBL fold metallo-hydrolase [Pseudomonadota bacterium]
MADRFKLSRRGLLQGGAAALALGTGAGVGAGAGRALAAADMQGTQVPGYYRFMLGAFEITVLSDGSYELPTDLIGQNQPRETVQAYLEAHFLDPERRTSHVNIPLINTGEELILIDVGGGGNFLEGAGKLVENMEAAGYAPDEVDKVFITHAHPDHLWGLLDDFDDPMFPEAEFFISAPEWDFWSSETAAEQVPEMFQSFAAGAQRRLPLIEDVLTRTADGDTIAPGISVIDTPGHTPGHSSVRVESEGETLIVTADAMTHPFISFEHPGWWPGTDLDPAKAEASRRMVLEMAATERATILAYHLSFPGLGNVARAGAAYRFVPALWRWQL